MNLRSLFLLTFALCGSPLLADDAGRILFKFDNPQEASLWQTVNDGVMGGRSVGRFRINAEQNLEFLGNLSLENNGGFASVRSRGKQLGLQEGDSIVVQVRGDGRQYSLESVYAKQWPRRRLFLQAVFSDSQRTMARSGVAGRQTCSHVARQSVSQRKISIRAKQMDWEYS